MTSQWWVAKLLRMTFGRSSEKLSEQLELTVADIDERLAESGLPAEEPAAAPDAAADARKPTRRSLPEALPRDVVEYAAP